METIYSCPFCGSTKLMCKAWVNPNTGCYEYDVDEYTYCEDCNEAFLFDSAIEEYA